MEAEHLFPTDRNFSIPVALPWPHCRCKLRIRSLKSSKETLREPYTLKYLTMSVLDDLDNSWAPKIGGSVYCEFSWSGNLEEDLTSEVYQKPDYVDIFSLHLHIYLQLLNDLKLLISPAFLATGTGISKEVNGKKLTVLSGKFDCCLPSLPGCPQVREETPALEVGKPFPFTINTVSSNLNVGLIGQGASSLEMPGRFNDSLETDLPVSVVSFNCQIAIIKGLMWKSTTTSWNHNLYILCTMSGA